MPTTLALDNDTWDLVVDQDGNIATVSGAGALAQDAASACRLFLGELLFDTTQGVPYFQQLLAQRPPDSLIISLLQRAALTVPDVVTAEVTITSITARTVVGTVTITDDLGIAASAAITSPLP